MNLPMTSFVFYFQWRQQFDSVLVPAYASPHCGAVRGVLPRWRVSGQCQDPPYGTFPLYSQLQRESEQSQWIFMTVRVCVCVSVCTCVCVWLLWYSEMSFVWQIRKEKNEQKDMRRCWFWLCGIIFEHAYKHTRTHTHTQHTSTCTHIFAHTHTCACTHEHTYAHAHTNTYTYIHTRKREGGILICNQNLSVFHAFLGLWIFIHH